MKNREETWMFYKKVETENEHMIFENEWKTICEEMKNTYYPFVAGCERYLLLDNEGYIVGTTEYVPRNPQYHSIVEDYYPFENVDYLPTDASQIGEIGKISIRKNRRAEGFVDHAIACILDIGAEKGLTHFLAALNVDLYKILRHYYNIHVDIVGPRIVNPGHSIFTVTCDLEKIYRNAGDNYNFLRVQELRKKRLLLQQS